MKYIVGYFPDKKSVEEYIAQLPADTKVKRMGRGCKRMVSHDSPTPATDKCVIIEQTLFQSVARQRKQRYEFGRDKGKYIITTSPFEDVHIVWWQRPSHYCTPNSVSWKSDYVAEFPTREEAIAHIRTLTTKQQTLF